MPCVSFVDRLEPMNGGLRMNRQTDSGCEVLEAQTPLVVSITNDEHNVPRIPKVRDVMMSYRQPMTQWTLADLGYESEEDKYYEIVDLSIPRKESRCEFVTGDTLDERVESLAKRITEVTSAL
jgi:electron transfer flavoprotein beta subunit